MFTYKINSQIDENGNLFLSNLPFKKKQSVEVIILVKEINNNEEKTQEKIDLLKASFATIDSLATISDEKLSRENIYENDGR